MRLRRKRPRRTGDYPDVPTLGDYFARTWNDLVHGDDLTTDCAGWLFATDMPTPGNHTRYDPADPFGPMTA